MSEEAFEDALKEEFSQRGLTEYAQPETTPEPEEADTAPAEEAAENEGLPVRDDQGRFAKTDEPILGKFKDQDALIQGYQELERQQGERGNELGQLRQQVEQLTAAFQQPQQPTVDQNTVDWIDTLADQNPHGAAEWARANAPVLYDHVMETWYESDPRNASRYERALELQQYHAALQRQQAPVYQSVQAQAQASKFDTAFTVVAQEYPELAQHADALLEVAQTNTKLLRTLQNPEADVQDVAEMIENLWLRAERKLGRQADTIGEAVTQVAAEQQAANRAAKQGAFVASGASRSSAVEGNTAIDRFREAVAEAGATLNPLAR